MHGSFYCLDISEIEKAFGINFIKITFSWRRRRIWVRVWVSYLLPLKVESWELFEIAINAIELFFLISKVIGIKCNNLKMLFNKKVLIFRFFCISYQKAELLNYLAKGNKQALLLQSAGSTGPPFCSHNSKKPNKYPIRCV